VKTHQVTFVYIHSLALKSIEVDHIHLCNPRFGKNKETFLRLLRFPQISYFYPNFSLDWFLKGIFFKVKMQLEIFCP
jgi:hypothetical protein